MPKIMLFYLFNVLKEFLTFFHAIYKNNRPKLTHLLDKKRQISRLFWVKICENLNIFYFSFLFQNQEPLCSQLSKCIDFFPSSKPISNIISSINRNQAKQTKLYKYNYLSLLILPSALFLKVISCVSLQQHTFTSLLVGGVKTVNKLFAYYHYQNVASLSQSIVLS